MLIKEMINKIQSIKSDYAEIDQKVLDGFVKDLEEAEAVEAFANNFIIQDYLKRLTEDIARINEMLMEKRNLTEAERNQMMDKKELYRNFISLFDGKRKVEEIQKYIEKL